MTEPIQGGNLTLRTSNALRRAGLFHDPSKLFDLVKSGDIVRVKGIGEGMYQELRDYFGLKDEREKASDT